MEGKRQPSELFQSTKRPGSDWAPEKRRHPRRECLTELKYWVRDQWFRGTVCNISAGGVYIRTGARFYRGAKIILNLPLSLAAEPVQGVIAWVGFQGIGVKFREKAEREVPETRFGSDQDVLNELFSFRKEQKKMGKIKNKRVRWEPSSTPGVKYRLYWCIGRGVDYHSDHADLGNVTKINFPSDIPAFPLTSGKFELGISAITEAGNESELTKTTINIDFTVPEAPKKLMIDDA